MRSRSEEGNGDDGICMESGEWVIGIREIMAKHGVLGVWDSGTSRKGVSICCTEFSATAYRSTRSRVWELTGNYLEVAQVLKHSSTLNAFSDHHERLRARNQSELRIINFLSLAINLYILYVQVLCSFCCQLMCKMTPKRQRLPDQAHLSCVVLQTRNCSQTHPITSSTTTQASSHQAHP